MVKTEDNSIPIRLNDNKVIWSIVLGDWMYNIVKHKAVKHNVKYLNWYVINDVVTINCSREISKVLYSFLGKLLMFNWAVL